MQDLDSYIKTLITEYPDQTLQEIEKEDCEESLYEFLTKAWKYIDSSPFVDGNCIEAVAEHLMAVTDGQIKKLVINIPPRCAKSSLTSVAWPAWTWAQSQLSDTSGPGVQFLTASFAQQLSLRDNLKMRRLITSEWYQKHWGDRFQLMPDQAAKGRFDNNKKGSRLATSVGSALTGEGGNIIIVDDPNAAQEAYSEATIESTIEWWTSALSTRLNNAKTGAYVVIQQRLSERDLTGYLMSKNFEEWTHLCLPMRFSPSRSYTTSIGWSDWRTQEGELLWPERFGEEEVKNLETNLGPFAAAGQLQQLPVPKGGGIIDSDWWKLWEASEYPPFSYIVAALDTAYTEKEENDFSAMSIWGVFEHDITAKSSRIIGEDGRTMQVERSYGQMSPRVMLIGAWQARLQFHDLVEKVQKTAKQFNIDKLLIEAKAAGISVSQELRRVYGAEEFAVQLVDYKGKGKDKVSRLYAVQHLFAEGLVFAPEMSWSTEVIEQVASFPKGAHDDLVDTVSIAMSHIRQTGLLQRPTELAEELEASKKNWGKPPVPLYPV